MTRALKFKTFKNFICFMKKEQSYASCHHTRKSCVLLTFGFNMKSKNIKEKKEVVEVLIHLS